jgi:hypothetical protein
VLIPDSIKKVVIARVFMWILKADQHLPNGSPGRRAFFRMLVHPPWFQCRTQHSNGPEVCSNMYSRAIATGADAFFHKVPAGKTEVFRQGKEGFSGILSLASGVGLGIGITSTRSSSSTRPPSRSSSDSY